MGFSFGFGEFGLGKKVSVLVSLSENLVSEKSLSFGNFGIGKFFFGIVILWLSGCLEKKR